jgi:hypothetical protein
MERTSMDENESRILQLEEALRESQRELREAHRGYVQAADLRDLLKDAIRALPAPRATYVYAPRSKGTMATTAVLCLGDLHYDLVVPSEEVQGYNEYNSEIADERMAELATRFLSWVETHRHAYPITDVVILGLGDFVDGNIHIEQLMYSESSPPKAAIRAGYAIGRLLATLSPHFTSVRFEGTTADNHGRLTKKTMAQGRGQWNWTSVVYEVAELVTRNCPNVVLRVHNSVKVDVSIGGYTILMEHGNDVRGWNGIPYYGIDRMMSKEARRRAVAGKPPVDLHVLGHWHTYHVQDQLIMNSALCGTTPYDHVSARFSKPGQVAFLVGERGPFGAVNFTFGLPEERSSDDEENGPKKGPQG